MKKIVLAGVLFLTACGADSGPVPKDEFSIVGHRGASAYVPENTLESFALAEQLDADYVELDIHLTADDQVVVMHDSDVDKTTDTEGDILSFTLEELKELSADFSDDDDKTVDSETEGNYEVPTLREVLDEFSEKLRFVVELKDPARYIGIEEKLVMIMEEYDLVGWNEDDYAKALVHSFDEPGLKKVHELKEEIPLLQLIKFEEDEEAELSDKEIEALKEYAIGVGITYEAMTKKFVDRMHDNDLIVHAYTVNDKDVAIKMKEMGVNGIHTDKPDIMDK